jgi:hypothetical protein
MRQTEKPFQNPSFFRMASRYYFIVSTANILYAPKTPNIAMTSQTGFCVKFFGNLALFYGQMPPRQNIPAKFKQDYPL